MDVLRFYGFDAVSAQAQDRDYFTETSYRFFKCLWFSSVLGDLAMRFGNGKQVVE